VIVDGQARHTAGAELLRAELHLSGRVTVIVDGCSDGLFLIIEGRIEKFEYAIVRARIEV
jgi:hypothetical protein